MERKVVFFKSCGVGTEQADAFIVPECIDDAELSEIAYEFAVEHAEAYGVYMDDDGEFETEISGYWEEYDAKKHDGDLLRGYDQKVHWNRL